MGMATSTCWGFCQGAAEEASDVTVTTLLESMVERGIKPGRRMLFVIDGSKALRAGIDRVYGSDSPVQRCRNHKLRNVAAHLPEDQQDQAKAALRAAWKLPAKEGMDRLKQLARWFMKTGLYHQRRQHSGRAGRNVHDQSSEPAQASVQVSGDHQPDRLGSFCGSSHDRKSDTLATWIDGAALGSDSLRRRRKAFSENPGMRATVDPQGATGTGMGD